MEMHKHIPELHPPPQKWHIFEHYNFYSDPCSLFQINWCTHRLQATFTLSSTFPRCTAKSINKTVSSLSAAAVFSTRLPQWLPAMCISYKRYQYGTLTIALELTFQLYIFNTVTKGMQVMFFKSFLCHLRYTPVQVFIWIVQHIHLDIAQEVVIFGKHGNNGYLKVLHENHCYECSKRRTVSVPTNVLIKLQIEPWSMAVHGDAVPDTKAVSCRNQGNGSRANHIACNLFRNLFSAHLRRMNSLNVSSSSVLPHSIPRES